MHPQKNPENETPSQIVMGLQRESEESRTGYQRFHSALRMRTAKKKVDEYKAVTGEESSKVTSKDILGLMDSIDNHPEQVLNADRTITLYTRYPYLLRANWTHDRWDFAATLGAKSVNTSRVSNGLTPILAAVDALLKEKPRSQRLLHHITCKIMRCLRHSVPVGEEDLQKMKAKCLILKSKHVGEIPANVTRGELCEADMTGVFLAVLSKMWYETKDNDELEKLLQTAEKCKVMMPAKDVKVLMKKYDAWKGDNVNGDVAESLGIQQRMEAVLEYGRDKGIVSKAVEAALPKIGMRTKSRPRVVTDKYKPAEPIEKPAASKKNKNHNWR